MAEQQQSSTLKVSTIEEIKQFWEDHAKSYLSKDQGHNGFYYTLINMLKLEERKSILEVGAGGGYLYNHSLQRKLHDADYYATDLSDTMLDTLCQRMGAQYTPSQTTYIPNYKLHISNANGEQLPFKDNMFDCYICNLCLNITTNPDKMLSEAMRVLQKGGYAGFSVWGDKERSKFFTLANRILSEQFGVQLPQVRNSFHLNDKEKLIKLLEEAGFTNILCWNQFQPFAYIDQEDIQALFNIPTIKDSLKKAGDRQEEFKQVMMKEFQQIIITNREPIGLDGLMVIAKKP